MKARMVEKAGGRWLITKGRWIFRKSYCTDWKGWIRPNHYLYGRCFMDYKKCITVWNYLTINKEV